MTGARIAGASRDDIQALSAGLGSYAATRLVTLEDGVERGMRVVEMRSGGGLDLDVMVDRSGDIGRLAMRGQTLSWHPAGGLAAPWNMDRAGDMGQGFLRGGYGGFLNTCGLDHIRQPESDEIEQSGQDGLGRVDHPLHGTGVCHPGALRGHGLVDDVADPYVFCEIEFVQAMSFVSALRLRRRIEVPVGGTSLRLRDVVRNIGPQRATHMLLYHFNLGFPLVGPGSTLSLGQDQVGWMSEPHVPDAPFPEPAPEVRNLLSVFEHGAARGDIRLENPQAGVRLHMSYPSAQLPFCQILRVAAQGHYCMGIEPCTAAQRTRAAAREQGEMILLQPGDERAYDLNIDLTDLKT